MQEALPNVDLSKVPESIQKLIKTTIDKEVKRIQAVVQDEIRRQSPIESINAIIAGGLWKVLG